MPSTTQSLRVLALTAALAAPAHAQTAGGTLGTGGLDAGSATATSRGDRGMANATRAAEGRTQAPAGIGSISGGVGAGAASGTVGGGVDSGAPR